MRKGCDRVGGCEALLGGVVVSGHTLRQPLTQGHPGAPRSLTAAGYFLDCVRVVVMRAHVHTCGAGDARGMWVTRSPVHAKDVPGCRGGHTRVQARFHYFRRDTKEGKGREAQCSGTGM